VITKEKMAKYIDHTMLKPGAAAEDIERLCEEAKAYGFYSVCVNPCYVALAVEKLKGTDVKVGAAVGFPLGATTSAVKAFEAAEAIKTGAQEVDMVINIGLLKDGDFYALREDIEGVVKAVKQIDENAKVKVILETCYLSEDEKVSACRIAKDSGADFLKTSTGFGTGGATVEDVRLMKAMCAGTMEVKAAGGIRDLETALAMIDAGAARIGTSSGIAIADSINE